MTPDEYATKWANVYPPHRSQIKMLEFQDDVRKLTGAGLNQVVEAIRIEDWNFNLVIDRLRGRRPPEWRLRFDELEERIRRIESILNIS